MRKVWSFAQVNVDGAAESRRKNSQIDLLFVCKYIEIIWTFISILLRYEMPPDSILLFLASIGTVLVILSTESAD